MSSPVICADVTIVLEVSKSIFYFANYWRRTFLRHLNILGGINAVVGVYTTLI